MHSKCIENVLKNALKMRYIFEPVGNTFQCAVIIFECIGNVSKCFGNVRQRVEIWLDNALQTSDHFHCHAIKENQKPSSTKG